MKRRDFIKGSMAIALGASTLRAANKRPNILWLTSEDNSAFLGCYGDKFARTPNLDKFSKRAVLFENAFSNVPVCAPARSTIISGLYASSMGTLNMRSVHPTPEKLRFYSQYLMEAGYYCTNNSKQDYNRKVSGKIWNESSKTAHYDKRPNKSKPFFAIFNDTTSHESSVFKNKRVEPKFDYKKVPIPPYHPDTEPVRKDWAQYYTKVEMMDRNFGKKLADLKKKKLDKDTIVFYYSDHGGVLPRSKRFLYDSGMKVPFMIHIPEKFKHLSPWKNGTRTDEIIGFVDLAATLLSIVGVTKPDHMDGRAYLGKNREPAPEYAYGIRNRMDERYDMMRAMRDKKFKYIRNFMPHRPLGQVLNYLWNIDATRSWEEEYKAGRCNKEQSAFWERKPGEELYEIANDPWEVKNLAGDKKYASVLARMRKALSVQVLKTRDACFFPEGELLERSKGSTPYDLIQNPDTPLERIFETAIMASDQKPEDVAKLGERLSDNDSAVRYWAAMGALILGKKALKLKKKLKNALKDSSGDVRVVSAEALANLGEDKPALAVLTKEIRNPNGWVALNAMNALDYIGDKARKVLPEIRKLKAGGGEEKKSKGDRKSRKKKKSKGGDRSGGYVGRMADYLIKKLG